MNAVITVNVNVNKDGHNAALFGEDDGHALAVALADFLEGMDVVGGTVTVHI